MLTCLETTMLGSVGCRICACVMTVPVLLLSLGGQYLLASERPADERSAQVREMFREANMLPGGTGKRRAFLRERILAMGPDGIAFLLSELKKPDRKPGPRLGMRVATFACTAAELYAELGQDPHVRLLRELDQDPSYDFWRNACYVYARCERDDAFDLLARWVLENGADARSERRISGRAYELLRVKLRRNGLPAPLFSRRDDDLRGKFREWWQSNRETVLRQRREQNQPGCSGPARDKPAMAPSANVADPREERRDGARAGSASGRPRFQSTE